MESRGGILICLALIFCLTFSCTGKISLAPEIEQAQGFVDVYPDSALLVLESIDSPERKLNEEQFAMYCLLVTEAKDKAYMTHTSDSLISVAVNYFDKGKDNLNKAKAWFYMGRVNQDLLQAEKAIDCYLKAIPYAEETNQNRLLSLIYNHISNQYRQQKMIENALAAAEKTYEYSVLVNDTINIAFALRDIGRIYVFLDQIEKTLDYYDKALALAEEHGNKYVQVSILNDMGVAYEEVKNYPKALEVVHEAISLTDDSNQATNYLSLGSLYLRMNQTDSARLYLKKAYDSNDTYVKGGASYYLYRLSKEYHNFENALQYYEYYQDKRELMQQNRQKEEILKLTHQYEQSELKKEMELRTVRERFFYSCCILFLLIVLAVGYFLYMKYRWSRERLLRLKEKQIQYEKELRLMSEEQIRYNREQIELNNQKLISKEEALESVNRELLNYNTSLLQAENELIKLRREEYAFRNKLFDQTGMTERIRLAGIDSRKVDSMFKPFTLRDFPELIRLLNEIYSNFVDRLQRGYPQLKDRDLEICYLIKAGAKTGNIAEIIAMTPNAVTKKKRLILDRMEIIDNNASLEDLLEAF